MLVFTVHKPIKIKIQTNLWKNALKYKNLYKEINIIIPISYTLSNIL